MSFSRDTLLLAVWLGLCVAVGGCNQPAGSDQGTGRAPEAQTAAPGQNASGSTFVYRIFDVDDQGVYYMAPLARAYSKDGKVQQGFFLTNWSPSSPEANQGARSSSAQMEVRCDKALYRAVDAFFRSGENLTGDTVSSGIPTHDYQVITPGSRAQSVQRLLCMSAAELDNILEVIQKKAPQYKPLIISEDTIVGKNAVPSTAKPALSPEPFTNESNSAASAGAFRYEPAVVTLRGQLISARGESPDGKEISFPALQLQNSITLQGTQEIPTEKGVLLMHVVLDSAMMDAFTTLKGKQVVVTGKMFHSDNGNHHTNVLITPSSIGLASGQ